MFISDGIQVITELMKPKYNLRPVNSHGNIEFVALDLIRAANMPQKIQQVLRALAMSWWVEAGGVALEADDGTVSLPTLAKMYAQWVTAQIGCSAFSFKRHEIGSWWNAKWAKKSRKLATDLKKHFPVRPPPMPRSDGLFMDFEELAGLLY